MNVKNQLRAIERLDLKRVMANQKRYEDAAIQIVRTDPWIPITLGKLGELKFELSFAAAREIYRRTDKNLNAGELKMEDLQNMDILCTVLTCGLMTHQPELTEAQIEANLTLKHRIYYAHIIGKAMEATQPDLADMESIIAELKALSDNSEAELEAGDTSAPLPEIVPSPISGGPVEN